MSVKGMTHLIGSEHTMTLAADTMSGTIIARCKLDDASTIFTAYHWRANTLIVLWAFLCRHAKGIYKNMYDESGIEISEKQQQKANSSQ